MLVANPNFLSLVTHFLWISFSDNAKEKDIVLLHSQQKCLHAWVLPAPSFNLCPKVAEHNLDPGDREDVDYWENGGRGGGGMKS